ncbi:hypothetical protein [Nocardia bovistercoris]|uniref:Uncharacterized protein n=1 Tax=Nocardia bovistercoris TaxID=2785916 RepID=A0A931N2K1_9NOCA|nr:hypothetical protein [Nocardia bovistercoris]MBH0775598.1 hypothetical protein [Nocardia bovistercoris]
MRRITPRGERYRPNSGGFETTAQPSEPLTYQRPHTHESDVTVRLRRCREPLPNTATLWLVTPRRLRVEPLELELAQPLPDVCAVHGRPASAREPTRTYLYDTDIHPRFHRTAVERDLAKVIRLRPIETAPVSTIVVGEWPTCDRCHRTSLRYKRLALALLWLMAADLVALVIAVVADIDALIPPLALGLLPGSFPLGLVALILLLKKSSKRVTFRPIYDERFAFIAAHANFRAALNHPPPDKHGPP